MVNHAPITDFSYEKVRALLVYLAVEHEPISRDDLAFILWPDQSAKDARHSLSQALLTCRRALNEQETAVPYFITSRSAIQLNPDLPIELDTAQFQDLLAQCRSHNHDQPLQCKPCMARKQQAIHLYRGNFLQNVFADSLHFEEWVSLKRESFHRQAMELLEQLTWYHENRGEIMVARQFAQRQVTLEPWREEAHRHLMSLLLYSGERSAALAQYEQCVQILATEFNAPPAAETQRLYETIKAAYNQPPDNLPPMASPCIGRDEELAELSAMIANPEIRLITLVAPGGMGKTSLALAAATHQRQRPFTNTLHTEQYTYFTHGIYFISLADIFSASGIIQAIIHALKLPIELDTPGAPPPQQQLHDYLRPKRLLLLLDNFDQLLTTEEALQSVAILHELLQKAPDIKLLITSRERLQLQEEYVYPIYGLAYPDHNTAFHNLQRYPAMLLFHQAAKRVLPTFTPQPEDQPAIAYICRMIEGMPLGIELAATAVTVLTPQEIARELNRSLDVLVSTMRNVPPRHRSIRAALDTSWQRLSPQEQHHFIHLCVFDGGFTREAARQIANVNLPDLQTLMNKSFIHYQHTAKRYAIHSVLHQFGREKLAELPAMETAVRQKHSNYYASTFSQIPHPPETLAQWQQEINNIRRAWQWLVAQQQYPQANKWLPALINYYRLRGPFQAATQLLETAVQQTRLHYYQSPHSQPIGLFLGELLNEWLYFLIEQRQLETAVAISAELQQLAHTLAHPHLIICTHYRLGQLYQKQANYSAARHELHQVLAQTTTNPHDQALRARSLRLLGAICFYQGEFDTAQTHYEQALALFQTIDDAKGAIGTVNNLALIYYVRHNYILAQRYFQQAETLYRDIGDRWGQGVALVNLGNTAQQIGHYQSAIRYYEQSLMPTRAVGDQFGEGITLVSLALSHHNLQQNETAVQYCQAALTIGQTLDDPIIQEYAHTFLGHALTAQGHFSAAADHYQQAIHSRQQRGQGKLAIEAQAGLIQLHLAQNQTAAALALVEQILPILAETQAEGAEEPLRVYYSCYLALQAAQDPRATPFLHTAYNLLQSTAAHIPDASSQKFYLNQVSAHRQLLQAWQNRVEPSFGE
jgi:DNA-binding SARP family transcriptional activator/predicted ATPase